MSQSVSAKVILSRTAQQGFDYRSAFSRSLGLLTEFELDTLQTKTLAIAGLGGVGGHHLLTLTRLGIGGFHLAEFDHFAIENFNRQVGATIHSIDRSKLEVMIEQALAINPHLRITRFPSGLNENNMKDFLKGIDLYVDGLDYFAFSTRSLVFKTCRELEIPAITAGPIGIGTAHLNFLPGQMSFHEYFDWHPEDSDNVLAAKFLVGLSPSLPHRHYLVDPSRLNLKEKRGPSLPMACDLCAGVAATEAMKILLKRGPVLAAPHSIQYDAYSNTLFSKRVWYGNRNPWQRFKIAMILRKMAAL